LGAIDVVMDDDELIAALAAGDDTALRELFMRHAPWLAARLRAALPPPDVEDVLQETFLAVWTGAKGYQPRGTPPIAAPGSGRPWSSRLACCYSPSAVPASASATTVRDIEDVPAAAGLILRLLAVLMAHSPFGLNRRRSRWQR
jgi:Sigma-70 region 2